tara:strand:- start:74 stop:1477 length:1404 start_codon:yes stop_codon:yes gene_type:complete
VSLPDNLRKWAAANPAVVKDWRASSDSINKDLKEQSAALRARARDLEQNSDYVAKWLMLTENNTVGEQGIKLQAKVKTSKNKLDTRTNRLIEREFGKWQRSENCTIDGRLDWLEVQKLIIRSCARDGEVLIRLVKQDGLKLAIYDADFLDNDLNRPPGDNSNQIIQGIEVNRAGRPLAYYLLKSNPNDMPTLFGKPTTREYERVSAENILHIFKTDRPNQVRGASWMASVMVHLMMLLRYEKAELLAAEFSAKKIGYYRTPTGDWLEKDEDATDYGLPESINGLGMVELPEGVEMDLLDPNHPVSAFSDFVRGVLMGIATGLGVTYHALSGDLTQVNFSSIRAGTIEERDRYRSQQQWLINKLHRPIYEAWLRDNITRLGFSDSDFDRLSEVTWQPRGFTHVDPVKDIQAHQIAYQLGVTSLSDIAGAQGKDLEEIFSQRASERALADTYGVEIADIKLEVDPDGID